MQYVHSRETIEGEYIPVEQIDLNLDLKNDSDRLFLVTPQTISHPIDKDSPLWDLRPDDLENADFEVGSQFVICTCSLLIYLSISLDQETAKSSNQAATCYYQLTTQCRGILLSSLPMNTTSELTCLSPHLFNAETSSREAVITNFLSFFCLTRRGRESSPSFPTRGGRSND